LLAELPGVTSTANSPLSRLGVPGVEMANCRRRLSRNAKINP
jgi:hypothetical protein